MTLERVLSSGFAKQWSQTGEQVLQAVRSVGEAGSFVLGRRCGELEQKLGVALGVKHVVTCASGLDAIELALRAAGLKPGDRVLTTPLSAFATCLGIVRAGGVPVFVDVDQSAQIDLDLAERCLLSDATIRFLLPVHLYGHACNISQLQQLTARSSVRLVEDCCQAIGARSDDRPVGTLGHGGALSFYPTKNLGALGDGGAVITQHDDVARTCRALRDYGQAAKYVHQLVGMNSRLDEIHAAILANAFLPRLAEWTARRRIIAERYAGGIENDAVQPIPGPPGSQSVWHLFPVLIDEGLRESFMAHLDRRGVQCAIHYPTLIPHQAAMRQVPSRVFGSLENAEAIARREVSIPLHPFLDDDEVQRVLDAVNTFRP